MAIDPAFELHRSIYNAIKALAEGKVYHRVPPDTKAPYLVLEPSTIVSDYDSYDLSDCTATVQVVAPDKLSAMKLAGEVRGKLDLLLVVAGFHTIEGWFEDATYRTQQDGQTEVCTIDFHYLLMPTTDTP